MGHPDHETRVGAHSVFSVVIMPSLRSPWSDKNKETIGDGLVEGGTRGSNQIVDVDAKRSTSTPSPSHLSSFKRALTCGTSVRTKMFYAFHMHFYWFIYCLLIIILVILYMNPGFNFLATE